MKAYSMDLRVRVLADGDAGLSTAEVAEKQRVSASWVRRLKQRRRETGEIAPRPAGYPPPKKLAGQEERLRAYLRATPDATLAKVRRDLGLDGVLSPLWRRLRELKLTLKKSPAGGRTGARGRGRPAGPVANRAGQLGSGAARVSRGDLDQYRPHSSLWLGTTGPARDRLRPGRALENHHLPVRVSARRVYGSVGHRRRSGWGGAPMSSSTWPQRSGPATGS